MKLNRKGKPSGLGPKTVVLLRSASHEVDIAALPRGMKRRLAFLRNLGLLALHNPFIGSGEKYTITEKGTKLLERYFPL